MITGKSKLEEQFKSAQKKILKLADSQDAVLLSNVNLNNELTLKMQNIYVTQATTAQLRAKKKEPETKLQQTAKQIFFDPE